MFLWLSFSSHSLLLLSPFLLTFYNSDHEENESELDERKLLLLNQIGRRNGREEGTKLTGKRTKSRRREEDNKESVEFYDMINGEKIVWFAFVCS
jgi:hypothetical protein